MSATSLCAQRSADVRDRSSPLCRAPNAIRAYAAVP